MCVLYSWITIRRNGLLYGELGDQSIKEVYPGSLSFLKVSFGYLDHLYAGGGHPRRSNVLMSLEDNKDLFWVSSVLTAFKGDMDPS